MKFIEWVLLIIAIVLIIAIAASCETINDLGHEYKVEYWHEPVHDVYWTGGANWLEKPGYYGNTYWINLPWYYCNNHWTEPAPVPEPATMGILTAGLLFIRRRKNGQ